MIVLILKTFKFLTDKPITMFKDSPQFLHMLKAEEEGLVTISIRVADAERSQFVDALLRCATTNDYGSVASAWNDLRRSICEEAFDQHMVPAASKWARDHLRSMAEEFVAERCRMELEFVGLILNPKLHLANIAAKQCSTLPNIAHGCWRDTICLGVDQRTWRFQRRCHGGHARRGREHPHADQV